MKVSVLPADSLDVCPGLSCSHTLTWETAPGVSVEAEVSAEENEERQCQSKVQAET